MRILHYPKTVHRNPKKGDIRVIYKFLWLPLTLPISYTQSKQGNPITETRWLEYSSIVYEYKDIRNNLDIALYEAVSKCKWVPVHWST